ncbi:MAG: GTPase [Pirellulales bacterium]|nr:GTPase [Pirellulales bacterium]
MSDAAYHHWADQIRQLAEGVKRLDEQIAGWPAFAGDSLADQAEWRGALFSKLLPQVTAAPYLIAAVCGGTNTGKSVIFNHLAGHAVSQSHHLATQTKHPVCSVPRDFAQQHDLAVVFPDFELRVWKHAEEALADGSDNLLLWRADPTGRQPESLVVLDTPDVDGVLSQNHQRAELVRHAADVLIAVLTQQKYNDAVVRDFFAAAARADKTVLAIINMVHWPRQEPHCAGWLQTFVQQTGVRLRAAYAAPWNPDQAESLSLEFFPLTPGATTPQRDLAELQFGPLKQQALAGSLREVLHPTRGLPAWLAACHRESREHATAYELLARDLRVRMDNLPQLPRRAVWDEIWTWLARHRSAFDRWVNGFYSQVSGLVTQWFTPAAAEEVVRYQEAEWHALQQALEEFLDRLGTLRRGGNAIIRETLTKSAPPEDRRRVFEELRRRHAQLPLLSDGYRRYVREQLDQFGQTHPGVLRGITWSLFGTAIVRPVVTIGLGLMGAHLVDLAGGHLINVTGDLVVGTATAVTGEGLFAGAMVPVQHLLAQLFNRFYAERGELLANLLHDLVLGEALLDLHAAAELTNSAAWKTVQGLITNDQVHITN